MKLEITLSASEEANVGGWVNHLAAHPEYIGKPTGNWNNGQPDYQTRIILEQQTRERYEEIAKQFGGAPTGPLVQFALAWGDGTRHPTKQIPLAWTTEIIVMELKVPAGVGPFSTGGRTSVYEFDGGPPRAREMTVSNIAGDFANPLFRAGGVAAQIIWNVGAGGGDVQLDAGSRYYFNFRNSTSGEGNYDAAIETQFPHN